MTVSSCSRWLNAQIDELDATWPPRRPPIPMPDACITHPGVGPLTALTTVLVLGPVARFPDSKHVVSYVGLAPAVNASADKYRLGHITKQGSALLRWVLGQAAPLAPAAMPISSASTSPSCIGAGGPKPRSPWPGKLLVRLYIMLRDQIDYDEFRRRGRARRRASSRRALRCSRGRTGREPTSHGTVPVRAFSG